MIKPDVLIAQSQQVEQEAERYLTVKEYAKLKRVHPETVKDWIKRQYVRAERTGPRGRWRILAGEVQL